LHDVQCKLSGFGHAHNWTNSKLPKDIVGQWQRAAPEALLEKTQNMQTDVYAVGIMIHEMILGTLPFNQET